MYGEIRERWKMNNLLSVIYEIFKNTVNQIYVTKQKQNNWCRKQTRGYQWEEGRGMGQDRGRVLRDTHYVWDSYAKGYIVQYREM